MLKWYSQSVNLIPPSPKNIARCSICTMPDSGTCLAENEVNGEWSPVADPLALLSHKLLTKSHASYWPICVTVAYIRIWSLYMVQLPLLVMPNSITLYCVTQKSDQERHQAAFIISNSLPDVR